MTTESDKSINTSFITDPKILSNYYEQGSDVNLIDLWLSLIQQKKIFMVTISATIILAIVYIITMPETFTYKTSVTIGTQQAQIIQSPSTIAANFNTAIIPKILRLQHLKHPDNQLDVFASIPESANFVLLTSKGTSEQKETVFELHQQLVTALADYHRDKVEYILNYLKQDLIDLQLTLTKLKKEASNSITYNEQITLQLINIENNIRQTKRSIIEFIPTHSVIGTVQSINPTSLDSKTILAVSIILGIFIGFFTALFTEFISKAKKKSLALQSIS